MSTKTKSTAKKSAPAKKTATAGATRTAAGERLRKAAMEEIRSRIDGSAAPAAAPDAPETKATAKREKKAATPKPDRKPSGLDLAARALAERGTAMNLKEITERVLATGWQTSGKTPGATLYAAMIREIATKGAASRFAKHGPGTFIARGA